MSDVERQVTEGSDLLSHFELGVAALDRGDAEGAAHAFAAAVAAATPSDDRLLAERAAYGAAEALLRLERDDEAAEYLAIAANSADRDLRFLALRRRAVEEVRRGDLAAALATYQEAEGIAPDRSASAEIASRIGWLTKETGGSTLRARAAFRRARGVSASAWVPRALLAVTIALSVITKLDPALAELFALIKIAPDGADYLTGSPWRLVTAAFVHGGIDPGWQSWAFHLGFNAIALDIAAQLVHRLYGAKRLVGWYLLGVAGASLASAIWLPYGYSVGASGGVFALFGIAVGAEWAHRPLVERGMREALRRVGGLLLLNIVLGLSVGFVGGGIDNSAHIGGLVTGLVFGLFVRPTRAEAMRRRWSAVVTSWRGGDLLLSLVLLIVVVVGYLNWTTLATLRLMLPI
ncbi:MAG: rhomboid family intramembrane serine protease [bacterium]|nr:rhomboid family intramembrane serine protease [Candidatus Aquidulcis sp.]